MYKTSGLSDKAAQFEAAHFDWMMSQDTPGVKINIIEKDGGTLAVMIEILEDTTTKQIKDVIPLVLAWRNRLMEWQGIWQHGGKNLFLIELDDLHKGGMSYAELANGLNKRIEKYLYKYADFYKEYQAIFPKFKTSGDYWTWLHAENHLIGNNPPGDNDSRLCKSGGLEYARQLLEAIRYQETDRDKGKIKKSKRPKKKMQKDIDAILKTGLERIAKGQKPFEKDYPPIDGDRVKATLKSWRISTKYKIFKRERTQAERRARKN